MLSLERRANRLAADAVDSPTAALVLTVINRAWVCLWR